MNTIEYFQTLEGDKRRKEMNRILYLEPLDAFINTIPKSIRHLPYVKIFIETVIIKKYRVYKVEDNISMFSGEHDFLYDQMSGYAIPNIGGEHSRLMGLIWAIRNPDKVNVDFSKIENYRHARSVAFDIPDYVSEKFLTDGYGFFMSSVMTNRDIQNITISENFQFKKDKHIFKKFKLDYIENI